MHPQREITDDGLRLWAPAKINLNLLVGPRRADGFHDLDSLVAKVALYDRIDLHPRTDDKITFSCTAGKGLPKAMADCGPDDRNLVVRAAKLLETFKPVDAGVDIHLTKHIPPGKGLGGGSSDAASTLVGLNELWRLGLPMDRLAALGAQLGSDVPLFLGTPSSRMTGRGEVLAPAPLPPFSAVLLLPEVSTSTAAVYKAYDEIPPSASFKGKPLADRQIDIRELASAQPSAWPQLLENDLAPAALQACPPLREVWEAFQAAAGGTVCMTGSGSALFVLCDGPDDVKNILSQVDRIGIGRAVSVQMNPW